MRYPHKEICSIYKRPTLRKGVNIELRLAQFEAVGGVPHCDHDPQDIEVRIPYLHLQETEFSVLLQNKTMYHRKYQAR